MDNLGGRPTVMTEIVLKKLEEAFALGCTDEEASLYAGISARTLYNYQEKNEQFLQRKEQLKQSPVLLARTTVINNLHDPDYATWFLERKKKDEFSQRSEHTGADGKPLILPSEVITKNALDTPPGAKSDSQGQPQIPSS